MVLTTAETIGNGEEDWWDELLWSSKDEKKQLNLRNYNYISFVVNFWINAMYGKYVLYI